MEKRKKVKTMATIKIHKMLQSRNSGSRYGIVPRHIVIHYVGAISSAKNNCIYFRNNSVPASAHFFCDKEIWQSVPLSRAAWHCGGGLQDYGTKKVDGNKGATLHGTCRNQNSIGIELCCHKKNGRVVPTPEAINTAIPLVQWLMKKYDIPASRVIRHFDVTGKCCPNGYISKSSWAKLHKKLTKLKIPKYPTIKLKKGMQGIQVIALQKCLNKIINAGLEEDGVFGSKTAAAVKRFKKLKMGSKKPTSTVGTKTRKRIKELVI